MEAPDFSPGRMSRLNFDPNDEDFKKFVQYSQDTQNGVTKQRIEKLQDYGVPITLEKVRKFFSNSTLGKLAIAQTILFDKTCREYVEKDHEELSIRKVLELYLIKEGIATHVPKLGGIHWQEAIEAVHKANGLAIFAHPTTNFKDPLEVLEMFEGIDGVEIQPAYYENGYAIFEEYAKQNGLFLTYGSDYHGPFLKGEILERKENIINENIFGKIKTIE